MLGILKKHLDKSIMITGASVTGKTTLCRRLIVHFGLQPSPVHMTRGLRDGEIENIDGVFITEEVFKTRFLNSDYLQGTLESTYFSGSYYGCPKEWINRTMNADYCCFVCPTVKVAKEIKELLGKKIFWIHLVADSDVRQQRLIRRSPGMNKKDFSIRIKKGGIPIDITGHDLVTDTSYLNAWEIFFHALAHL